MYMYIYVYIYMYVYIYARTLLANCLDNSKKDLLPLTFSFDSVVA